MAPRKKTSKQLTQEIGQALDAEGIPVPEYARGLDMSASRKLAASLYRSQEDLDRANATIESDRRAALPSVRVEARSASVMVYPSSPGIAYGNGRRIRGCAEARGAQDPGDRAALRRGQRSSLPQGSAYRLGQERAAVTRVSDFMTTGAVSSFGINLKGRTYHVTVAPDPHRRGYSAKLTATGIGVIMDPNGASPSDALTRLVTELRDFGDKALATEIAKYAWFPLKVGRSEPPLIVAGVERLAQPRTIKGYLKACKADSGVTFNDGYNLAAFGLTRDEFREIDRTMHAQYGLSPVRTVAGVRKALVK